MNKDCKVETTDNEVKVTCCHHKWNGYTIDQLEQRRAINAVKCDLIKEQLAVVYNSATHTFTASNPGALSGKMNQYMAYAAYGVQFFKYARQMFNLYSNFKSLLGR